MFCLPKTAWPPTYSLVDLKIERPDFVPLLIKGVQIYPDRVALQECKLQFQTDAKQTGQVINIQPNVQVGNFPPKIPEDTDKALPPPSKGGIAPQPVVPEFIVVHSGAIDDSSAPNYTIRFKDYIKNVASCEIYPTWSQNTILANVYCILSFTLNRIYTAWYRGKGKNFDITDITAYDQAFNYGRNIYENISVIVDQIFTTYIMRTGSNQPFLAQYCDGVKVQCPGWLSQWGSKFLGDQGKLPIQILTEFYGNDVQLVQAAEVKGIPKAYPGFFLAVGSTGEPVRDVQHYLNTISQAYPSILSQLEDGIYSRNTVEAVRVFQSIFSLPQTGIVDFPTWYKLSEVYVGITTIPEVRSQLKRVEKIFYPPVINHNIPYAYYYDDI